MLKKYLVNPFTIFFVAALVFFWPISTFLLSLKNDALTYYYPIRTLISDALRNGELPLWTPFINMGYPLHADMQSGAWSPVVWIFSFLSNYSLAAFHYELIFYIALAGIGFYYLCRNLGCSKLVSYTMAFAFQFSGFMIDSVQFFTCISAAAFLPWIILFFRKMITGYKMLDALALAFFLFLLFTGGYPSFFIISMYLLIAYAAYAFFSNKEKISFLKKIFLPSFFSCIFFILLSLPAIISFIQHLPFIERGKQQALSFVLENSMNPLTTFSLISPFATTANDHWNNSNILMRNMYIGIIPLFFLVMAFFNGTIRKNKEQVFFLLMAVLMIGMAWGKFFFFRQAAYYILPLMNSFRHPALFRLFGIFFLLLVSATSMNVWIGKRNMKDRISQNVIILFIVFTIIAGIIAMLFMNNQIPATQINFSNIKNLLDQLNFQQRLLIQIPFLLTSLLLFLFVILKKRSIKLICLITLADLFFATQLNMPVTIIGSKKFNEVETLLNRNPVSFPIPGDETINENIRNSTGDNIISGSTLPFTKKIGRNDYYVTPGNLSLQDTFYESSIRDIVFNNPVLYLKQGTLESSSGLENKSAKEVSEIYRNRTLVKSTENDSIKILIQTLSANNMHATITSKDGGMLTYLQNKYPGWHAFIDDKETNISLVNVTFMGFYVPQGTHNIEFRYRPQILIIAWELSAISLIFLLLWMAYLFFAEKKSAKRQMGMV